MPKTANNLQEFLDSPNDFGAVTLRNREIKIKDFRLLTESLKTNKTVTSLDLTSAYIRDYALNELAKSLKVNTSLTSLNLEMNPINEKGVEALAKALELNSSVTRLDFNFIFPDVTALCNMFKINYSIRELTLFSAYDAIKQLSLSITR